ncbi:DUF305 domain-containing protein [Microbacterium sp. Leaf151]|uniref:DUF305 domain-containing protein n=1 Tax=Microbacterium sp. Leaf151 TaxID=1736276 RepID=UPI0006F848BC|nr:DUF305 domain-containing protein [Microbacterium sp. Leaf151]KQR23484.1 hypothetical protein ASF76_09945 [Microbacterium sp. Leaf151]
MRFRTLTVVAGTAATLLALSGCAPADATMPGMDHGSGAMTSTAPSQSAATWNAADEMFVTMMIPHHEQAIEMADQILSKTGVDGRVVTLAEGITAAQGPEIRTMRGWLETWGVAAAESSSGMEGMADGMMSADDMIALDTATGNDAARLFLDGMIAHHEGAVTMAESILAEGKDPDVAALAQNIIDGQTAEIAVMREIRATL